MKNFTHLICLLLLSLGMQAQTFEWVKTPSVNLQLNPEMVGYSTVCDPWGNIFFTGFMNNSVVWSNDILGNLHFNKYAPDGGVIFTKNFEGNVASHNMVSDSQGNIIMAVSFTHLITYGDFSLAKEDTDMHWLLIKLDGLGNMLWQQELTVTEDGFNWMSDFRALTTDMNDDIYIGYDTFSNSYIKKISPFGQEQQTIVQEHVNRLTSVSVDNEGNIYAAGSCANINSTFGGAAFGTELPYNIYAAKYTPTGEASWVRFFEDVTCAEPHIAARTPDEVYFSSKLNGPIVLDCWLAEGPVDGFEDFFVAKLTTWSSIEWFREVPGSGYASPGMRNYLTFDTAGNVYFAGYTHGDVNWTENIATECDFSVRNALVVKYSPTGETLMVKTAGGNGYNRVDGIAVNQTGDVYLAGMANGTISFDTIEHEANITNNYPFLAKLNTTLLGTAAPQKQNLITLYPNPAANAIYLSGTEIQEGTIVNTLGQTIKKVKCGSEMPIDIVDLAPGTYFLVLKNQNALQFFKK